MNKSIALAVAFATVSTAAFADTASVLFNNSKVGQQVFYKDGTTKITDSKYVAQLFYSTDGTSFSALSTPATFNTSTSDAKAGYWSLNTKTIDFPASVQAGNTVTLKVAVWDSSLFANWDAAAAEAANPLPVSGKLVAGDKFQQGQSLAFSYTAPSGAAALNPEAFYMANFKSFSLSETTVTPEPSVVALGALGLGALLWRRRK